MKKVLFIATVSGHIKMFHTPYLDLFKKNQWKVYVAAKWNGDDKSIISKYCDVMIDLPISRSPLSVSNIKSISILKKICEKEKFDIIHCHTPMGAVVARLAARKARKKYRTRVIYTAHGFHFYKGASIKNWILFYPVELFLAKYTDTLITINKEDYEFAKKKFSKRINDIQYVPGVGIDVNKFDAKMSQKEKKNFRESIGLKKDDFVLTCIARLDKNKNQGFIIECMNELVNEKNNIHLLLIGPDEINGYYQKIASNYNLGKNIHFLGKRNDVSKLLEISNIVVSASKREGLPVNIMEAMVAHVPVVAMNCRGMKDLIQNDENGYIVNTKYDFINRIKFIFENYDKLKKATQTSENVVKNYELKEVIKKYIKIYFK